MKFPAGERKKSAKFWALHPSEHPTHSNTPQRTPHPTKFFWPNAVWPNSFNKNWPNRPNKVWPNAAQLTLAKCGIGQIRFGQMWPNKDGQIRFGQMRPQPRNVATGPDACGRLNICRTREAAARGFTRDRDVKFSCQSDQN